MAKLTKNTAFKVSVPKPETAMDKTTRVVKTMIDDEAEKRRIKMARLRTARLEREANTPADANATAGKARKPKAVKKS